MATVDIVGVGNKISILRDKSEINFESLDEYHLIAKRIISSCASRIRTGLAEEMLRNDDAIANIAHSIMMADWKFDGRGNLFGYRKKMAIFAIQNYVGRSSTVSKRKTYSMDITFGDNGGSNSLSRIIEDSRDGPVKEVESKDISEKLFINLERILQSGAISNKQEQYLRLHYLEGVPMSKIGDSYGVSRQSVHDLIRRALVELKIFTSNDRFFRGIIDNEG